MAPPAARTMSMLASCTTRTLARSAVMNPIPSSRTLLAANINAITTRTYATPAGPPPEGFRQKPYPRWNEEKEGTFDKLGKYFLLTEMFRGMYVLLEQFFRPPYTIYYPFEKVGSPPRLSSRCKTT